MSVPVTITEAAALHIKDMMKEHEEENAFLRVGVKGGGCSACLTEWDLSTKKAKKTACLNSTESPFWSTAKALIL